MRKFLRRLLTVVVLVALVSSVVAYFRYQAGNAAPQAQADILDQTEVMQGDLRITVSGTGTVLPARQVPLLFESSGVVVEILAHEGDRVRAGDVVARLDTADLEFSLATTRLALDQQQIAYDALTAPPREVDIAAAQAALSAAQASVNAAYDSSNIEIQAELAAIQAEIARNRLWQAQLQRDIAVSQTSSFGIDIGGLLPDDTALTQEQIDQANAAINSVFPSQSSVSADQFTSGLNQAEYGVEIADANAAAAADRQGNVAGIAQAQAAVVSAQVTLDRLLNGATDSEIQAAQLGLQQAQLAVEQATVALNRAVLTAPFGGVIAQNSLTVGELPPSQTPAVVLVDDSAFFVDLAIDETDIVSVELDQPVELNIDALPDQIVGGRVSRIAVAPTVIGQLVTYAVRVAIDPTNAPIRIGMSGSAVILVDQLSDVAVVPNRFVRIDRNSQQPYLTIQDENGRFSEVPVELGLRGDTESQVLSGVGAGQTIYLLSRAQFNVLGGPPR